MEAPQIEGATVLDGGGSDSQQGKGKEASIGGTDKGVDVKTESKCPCTNLAKGSTAYKTCMSQHGVECNACGIRSIAIEGGSPVRCSVVKDKSGKSISCIATLQPCAEYSGAGGASTPATEGSASQKSASLYDQLKEPELEVEQPVDQEAADAVSKAYQERKDDLENQNAGAQTRSWNSVPSYGSAWEQYLQEPEPTVPSYHDWSSSVEQAQSVQAEQWQSMNYGSTWERHMTGPASADYGHEGWGGSVVETIAGQTFGGQENLAHMFDHNTAGGTFQTVPYGDTHGWDATGEQMVVPEITSDPSDPLWGQYTDTGMFGAAPPGSALPSLGDTSAWYQPDTGMAQNTDISGIATYQAGNAVSLADGTIGSGDQTVSLSVDKTTLSPFDIASGTTLPDYANNPDTAAAFGVFAASQLPQISGYDAREIGSSMDFLSGPTPLSVMSGWGGGASSDAPSDAFILSAESGNIASGISDTAKSVSSWSSSGITDRLDNFLPSASFDSVYQPAQSAWSSFTSGVGSVVSSAWGRVKGFFNELF